MIIIVARFSLHNTETKKERKYNMTVIGNNLLLVHAHIDQINCIPGPVVQPRFIFVHEGGQGGTIL